jgi:hypothetical protein
MIDPKAIKDSQFSTKSLPGITVWMARQELILPIFKRFNQNKPIPVTGYTLTISLLTLLTLYLHQSEILYKF